MAARTFEAWTAWKLQTLGICNDYLVNYMSAASWQGSAELDQGYPYPLDDELETLGPLVEEIASAGSKVVADWQQRASAA